MRWVCQALAGNILTTQQERGMWRKKEREEIEEGWRGKRQGEGRVISFVDSSTV